MKLFKSKVIRGQLTKVELAAFGADFTAYKTTGELPQTFGRDERYEYPTPFLLSKPKRYGISTSKIQKDLG